MHTCTRANVRIVGSSPSSARTVRSSKGFGLIRYSLRVFYSLEVPSGGTHEIRGGGDFEIRGLWTIRVRRGTLQQTKCGMIGYDT